MGIYLALGDSISIDDYTGVRGGGAPSQLARKLGIELVDLTRDGNTTDGVLGDLAHAPTAADVVTLTAGGNDLLGGDLPGAVLHRLNLIAERIQPLGARIVLNTVYDPSDGDNNVGRRELGLSWLATFELRRRLNAVNGGIGTLARERSFLPRRFAEQMFRVRSSVSAILPRHDPALKPQLDEPVTPTPPPRSELRPRTVVMVLAITIGALCLLAVAYLAWQAITWVLIAAFIAMALNPVVELFERRGLTRGMASAVTFLIAIGVFGLVAFLVIPPLVTEVVDFVENLPAILRDAENGRGPLGFLERRFDLVTRIERGLNDGGVGGVLGFTTPAIGVMKTVVTTIFALVAIAFLTFFMLLDGRRWVRGFLEFVPQTQRPRWDRIFGGIYRTVGGYVTGNLLVCVLAGLVAGTLMTILGVPYAIPLALLVALFNLVPMIGAPIAVVLITVITFVTEGWVDGVILLAVYVVYQQIENNVIQPLIYGRAVNLSPLAILVAVLVGAQLGGLLGAIAAIPIAGSIAVVASELLGWRRERLIETPPGVDVSAAGEERRDE